MAVRAYMLITTQNKETQDVLAALRDTHIVQQAQAVTGPYDIIAAVEVAALDDLGPLITQQVQAIEGIERTLTCVVLPM